MRNLVFSVNAILISSPSHSHINTLQTSPVKYEFFISCIRAFSFMLSPFTTCHWKLMWIKIYKYECNSLFPYRSTIAWWLDPGATMWETLCSRSMLPHTTTHPHPHTTHPPPPHTSLLYWVETADQMWTLHITPHFITVWWVPVASVHMH